MNLNHYKKLSGDASFRSFYRSNKSVIVYSKKDPKINLLIYDAINQLFLKNKINTPKLLKENYDKNYIEIEDLGDETILRSKHINPVVSTNKTNKKWNKKSKK